MFKDNLAKIHFLENLQENEVYIMRDDLLPFSFGGNKVRKAKLFFEEIDTNGNDAVITYGSGSSNHCRIIANMAAMRGLTCHIISTDDTDEGMNRRFVEFFGCEFHFCKVDEVSKTIEIVFETLKDAGFSPFFIPGGGHGNLGTKAYDLAYDEIYAYEVENGITFDLIFLASGTGTTQAGLVCGKMRHKRDAQKIVGISIARRNPRGKKVIEDSIVEYCGKLPGEHLVFDDSYIGGGYGCSNPAVDYVIRRLLVEKGIPLDPVYTGKAYCGMEDYLRKNRISGKRILFIHTGGTPIFFDWMKKQ